MARLLITNDDGIDAPGIHAIAGALHDAGHDVVVAAPLDERSGWGAGVGHMINGSEFDVEAREIPGFGDTIPAWGVEGPPAFCVLTAMMETFGPRPDLVVSGSNIGLNLGRGVLQSGTVGAAMIAQNFGLSGLAISQAHAEPAAMLWQTSGDVVCAAVDWLLGAERKTVLNINVPNLPTVDLKGVRWARLAAFGSSSMAIVGEAPGRLRVETTPRDVQLKPDTDTHQVDEGYVTVTGLVGFRHEGDISPGAAEAIAAGLR